MQIRKYRHLFTTNYFARNSHKLKLLEWFKTIKADTIIALCSFIVSLVALQQSCESGKEQTLINQGILSKLTSQKIALDTSVSALKVVANNAIRQVKSLNETRSVLDNSLANAKMMQAALDSNVKQTGNLLTYQKKEWKVIQDQINRKPILEFSVGSFKISDKYEYLQLKNYIEYPFESDGNLKLQSVKRYHELNYDFKNWIGIESIIHNSLTKSMLYIVVTNQGTAKVEHPVLHVIADPKQIILDNPPGGNYTRYNFNVQNEIQFLNHFEGGIGADKNNYLYALYILSPINSGLFTLRFTITGSGLESVTDSLSFRILPP